MRRRVYLSHIDVQCPSRIAIGVWEKSGTLDQRGPRKCILFCLGKRSSGRSGPCPTPAWYGFGKSRPRSAVEPCSIRLVSGFTRVCAYDRPGTGSKEGHLEHSRGGTIPAHPLDSLAGPRRTLTIGYQDGELWPRLNPHRARGTDGAPLPRDFVPWRFSDAGLGLTAPAHRQHQRSPNHGERAPISLAAGSTSEGSPVLERSRIVRRPLELVGVSAYSPCAGLT